MLARRGRHAETAALLENHLAGRKKLLGIF
jgi:hypothetical protein